MTIGQDFFYYRGRIKLRITKSEFVVYGKQGQFEGGLRLDAKNFIFIGSDPNTGKLTLPFTQDQCSRLVNVVAGWLPQIQMLDLCDLRDDLRFTPGCMDWLTNNETILINVCTSGVFKFFLKHPDFGRMKFELHGHAIKTPTGLLIPTTPLMHHYKSLYDSLRKEIRFWIKRLSNQYNFGADLETDDDDDNDIEDQD